jgi:hypothetical protein
MSRESYYGEVEAERIAQIGAGYDTSHDREHDPYDWARLIEERFDGLDPERPARARSAFVQIAALCVAAMEAIDASGGVRPYVS